MNDNSPNRLTSEDRLHAFLYVLDDPSLDRASWEAKLEKDPGLCELVSEMVALHQDVVATSACSTASGRLEYSGAQEASFLVKPASGSPAWNVARFWLPAIAASLLVGFFLWAALVLKDTNPNAADSESRSIAAAWTDLQTAHHLSDEFESELGFHDASIHADDERDVPDWLIFASSIAPATNVQGVIQ
jgi:hypothetical protein